MQASDYKADYNQTIKDLCIWFTKLPTDIKSKAILFGSVADEKLFRKSYLARKSGKKATDVDIYIEDYDAFYDVATGIQGLDKGEAEERGLRLLGTDGFDDYVPNPDYQLGLDQLLPTGNFVEQVNYMIGDKIVDLFVEIEGVLHQYHYDHNVKRPVFSPVGILDIGKYDETFAEAIKKRAVKTGRRLEDFCQGSKDSSGHLKA